MPASGRLAALLVVVCVAAAGCGGGNKAPKPRSAPQTGGIESAAPGESLAPGETLAPGATLKPGTASRSKGKVSGGATGGVGGVGGVLQKIPDFGLKTQGITDKDVKVGFTYNVSGCGDAGTLSAMFGNAVTGDPAKSVDAFSRYVNDQKMLGDRKFTPVIADDGGGGCEEKAGAAAVEVIDQKKVFTVVPGLNVITDYAVARHIPVAGGRDDEASINKAGAGTFKILDSLDGALHAWSAFGRYYLDTKNHTACLIHPNNEEWNGYEKIAVAAMKRYDLAFKKVITYSGEVSTAQQEANNVAVQAKNANCDQAWFMFYNPIALVFLTEAAKNNLWFPTWTWTSFTVLVDDDKIAKLMDQTEWANAIGLSQRVPNGVGHPKQGNCKKIYEKYYPNDGQSDGAYVWLYCAQILPLAESMRRAISVTGTLNANSLMVGADAITNDLFFDAHVPIDWKFPGPAGPFKQRGMTHYTVAKWNASTSRYDFPEYPTYWEQMGAGKSGGFDLRSTYNK